MVLVVRGGDGKYIYKLKGAWAAQLFPAFAQFIKKGGAMA